MIVTKYPEWVEAQLQILDERMAKIYQEYSEIKVTSYEDNERLKRNYYERIKPLVDAKFRVIANSCPTYIIEDR